MRKQVPGDTPGERFGGVFLDDAAELASMGTPLSVVQNAKDACAVSLGAAEKSPKAEDKATPSIHSHRDGAFAWRNPVTLARSAVSNAWL